MAERLPPLTALRAFESAARHMSFAKAAEELHVTPAALSFQIKNLEEHLGQPLFHRLNRAVDLTEAGRLLSPGASEGFERLEAAWRATRRLQDSRVLSVTAGPAFTAKILAPNLYAFALAHPEIELRFAASLRRMDFQRDEVDVAVRYSLDPEEDLFNQPLMEEAAMPLMRPELAGRFPTPESLIQAPLIYDDSLINLPSASHWDRWVRAAGLTFTPHPTARFSQADHALDAALSGSGVVFSRSSIARRLLATGQLVAPYPIALRTRARFRVLCVHGTENRPQVAAFRSWLVSELDKLPTGLEDKLLLDEAEYE